MSQRVIIFDTTLRDGEQSPGVSLNTQEKLEIAHQLAKMKVDVIEAGFPISSIGDFEAVKAIAEEVKEPVICALARTERLDIDRAWEAVRQAERPRIHIFVSTSSIHMQYMLLRSPDEVLQMAVETIKYAKKFVSDIEFSPQDATRSDHQFLYRICTAAIEAGATTINIPDTVGYTTPREYYQLVYDIRERVPKNDQVIFSVHCHDDLGLAVANSLAAVEAGARQVECAINGIGERAGNTSLEEVVMALRTRKDYYGVDTGIATDQIARASRLVSSVTGMVVPPNKAIIGANAFAHESGIHQDGVLKEKTTYEIMKPEDIGLGSSTLVLGKLSGRHAFRNRLEEMGYEFERSEINRLFARFKDLADKKKDITERDLEAIIEESVHTVTETYQLESYQVSSSNNQVSMANVALRTGEDLFQEAAVGSGPVDAVYKAIDRAIGASNELVDYNLKAVTGGKDALGEVTVRIKNNGIIFLGRGISTDIIEASAKAYINAINKLSTAAKEEQPQKEVAVSSAP
ncbi:MAG: 2-isopropylmalate synthase [Bacillota bacterium]